jgi:(p)ppGpp synthase/HD superfamily hydrolase
MSDEPFVPTFLQPLHRAREALTYAAALHRGQRRLSDAAPALLHPLEVAALLHNAGYSETVVAAGVLHDTIEDGGADPDEIRARFGDEIANLVAALTEDPTIEPFGDRKAALRRQVAEYGAHATAVYAADKVAKVRELRARGCHERTVLAGDEGRAKLAHYTESLAMLEDRDAEHPLVRQLRFEIEALQAMPPG